MAMPIVIRPERPADFPAIRALVAAAFESNAEADLVAAIRASVYYVASMALVAESDGAVVGHVMISSATLRGDRGDRPIAMLAPLAVAPSQQRRGIGGALVRAVTTIADGRGEPFVIVEGSPAYYRRFGFIAAHELAIAIPLPDWAPRDAGQVLRLTSYDASLTGLVVYPPAFDTVAG